MPRESIPHKEAEFRGVKVSEYTAGQRVAVLLDGSWKLVWLDKDAECKKNKLVLTVSDAVGTSFSGKEIAIDSSEYTPPIATHINDSFVDPDSKIGAVAATEPYVTKDGRIEYTVENNLERYTGVDQEVFKLWKESAELDKRFRDLQINLQHLSAKKHTEFIAKNTEAQKMLAEIFSYIRDPEEMNTFDTGQIKKIENKLETLITQAKSTVQTLEKEISKASAVTPSSKRYSHVPTREESQEQEKDLEKDAKDAEKIKKDLETRIQARHREIDERKQEELDDIEAQIQREIGDAKQKIEQWKRDVAVWTKQKGVAVAGGLQHAPDANQPPEFNPRDLKKLARQKEKEFNTEKEQAEKEIYRQFFESARQTPFVKKVIDAVTILRKEVAENDVLTPDDKFKKTGTVIEDYDKPADPEYLDSVYLKVSTEALNTVLEKMKNKERLTVEKAGGAEEFDFDAQVDGLKNRFQMLRNTLLKKADGSIEKKYSDLDTVLQEQIQKIEKDQKDLSSKKKAETAGFAFSGTDDQQKIQLQEYRERQAKWYEGRADDIEREIEMRKAHTAVEEHVEAKTKEREKEIEIQAPVIDLPQYVMKELLKEANIPTLKDALTVLFEGGVEVDRMGRSLVTPDALEAFQNIFGTTPPSQALMEKLRSAGIKDWAGFKQLWDEKLAEQTLLVMDRMAQALLKKEIAEQIGMWDKLKQFKYQILARALTNAVLVGGGALALTTLLASGGVSGVGLAALGGGAGGAIKAGVNKVFGALFKGRNKRLTEQLEEKKKVIVVDNLVSEILSDIKGTPRGSTPKSGDIPSLSAVFAQTIRDITTELHKLTEEPEAAKKLQGNARVLYERALAEAETEDITEDQKNKLAQVIDQMNGKGDLEFEKVKATTDPKIISILESVLSGYSGKKGILASAGVCAVVGVALFAENSPTRAVLGGAIGGVAGFKEGKRRDIKAEQGDARKKIFADIHVLRELSEKVLEDPNFDWTSVPTKERESNIDTLIRLKRLLHISKSATKSELAVFGVVGQNEKGEWIDYQKNVIVSSDGRLVDQEMQLLFQDIRSTVADAEKIGLLYERNEDKENLETVLTQMELRGKKIEDRVEKPDLWKRLKKFVKYNKRKVGFMIGGAAIGVLSAVGIGEISSRVRHGLRGDSSVEPTANLRGRGLAGPGKIGSPEMAGVATGGVATGGVAAKGLENVVSPESTQLRSPGSVVPETVQSPHPETPEAKSFYSETSAIQKGEGILHAVNRLEHTELGKTFELDHGWKITELKNMGFVFEDGKWGYPFTVHTGAQVELYTETDPTTGEVHPHLRLIADEKQITFHDHYKFKSASGEVSKEVIERADQVAKDFSARMHKTMDPKAPDFEAVRVGKGLMQAVRVPGQPMSGIVDVEPIPNSGNVRLTLEDHRVFEAHPERIVEPVPGSDQEKLVWKIDTVEHSPALPLPDNARTNIVDSDKSVKVDEIKAQIMTPKQHEEWVTAHKGGHMAEGGKGTVAQESKVAQPEVVKKEVLPKTVENNSSAPGVFETREKYVNLLDGFYDKIEQNIRLVGNPDAAVTEDLLSSLDESKMREHALIEAGQVDTVKDPTEYFKNWLKESSLETKLFLEDFSNTTPVFMNKGLEIQGQGIISDVEYVDNEPYSLMRFRPLEGSKEYIFQAPRGCRFVEEDGAIVIKNSRDEIVDFKLSSDDLSKAILVPAEPGERSASANQ